MVGGAGGLPRTLKHRYRSCSSHSASRFPPYSYGGWASRWQNCPRLRKGREPLRDHRPALKLDSSSCSCCCSTSNAHFKPPPLSLTLPLPQSSRSQHEHFMHKVTIDFFSVYLSHRPDSPTEFMIFLTRTLAHQLQYSRFSPLLVL